MRSCSPWEGLTLEKVGKDCISRVTQWSRGHHAGVGEKREKLRKQQRRSYYKQAITPIPNPTGGAGEKLRVKLSPGRREEWEEGMFIFVLISHCLNCQYIKSILPKLSRFSLSRSLENDLSLSLP